MSEPTIVSKSEYAARRGVNATRISQYIAEGKIGPNALVGDGVRAKINVEIADKQLAERLDASQSFGQNGKAAASVLDKPAQGLSAPSESPKSEPPTDFEQSSLRRVAEEKARQAELQTAKMEREEALAVGRYTLTSEVTALVGRAASEAFNVMDRSLRDMINAVAAEFGVDKAQAATVLNKVWRNTRSAQAKEFDEAADELPENIKEESTASQS